MFQEENLLVQMTGILSWAILHRGRHEEYVKHQVRFTILMLADEIVFIVSNC